MVVLVEAPSGRDWWRGKVDEREGWFPKSYVSYIDTLAEEKKRKEGTVSIYSLYSNYSKLFLLESFATAAATIRVASMSFQSTGTPPSKKRTDEFPIIIEEPSEKPEMKSTFVIANSNTETPESSPLTERTNPPILSETIERATPSPPPLFVSPVPSEDLFVAKYDYQPQGESELQLYKGDQVIVIEQAEGGWWHGVIGEDHGWFPEMFVELDNRRSLPSYVEDETFRPRGMTEFHKGTSDEVEATGKVAYRQLYLISLFI